VVAAFDVGEFRRTEYGGEVLFSKVIANKDSKEPIVKMLFFE
jgi:hypothetical protein